MELPKRILQYYYNFPKMSVPSPSTTYTAEPPTATEIYLRRNSTAWIVFLPFVSLENILCLFVIAIRRKWKSPDVLFFSVVFNNLLTLIFPVTVYTIFIFFQETLTSGACKFIVWCVMSFRTVNVLQLAFLSLDRVWTLKWPGSYTVHNTANQNARTAGLMWLFGISIGSVPLIGWENIEKECSLVLDVAGAGYIFCVIILIIGSTCVSVGCVITMIIKLKFSDDILDTTGSKQTVPEIVVENETGERQTECHESRDLQNRQICTLVAWVVFVDIVINELPFTIFNFIALRKNTAAWLHVTITWCHILFCASVPVMLCVICRRYRLGLVKVLSILRTAAGCRKPPSNPKNDAAVSRQETMDSLDSYRPDELDEPINFPEPVSQDVSSMDDPNVQSSVDSEYGDFYAGNPYQTRAETYDNGAYSEDEVTTQNKRSEMSSQEKRAHFHALGARRKLILDARAKRQENGQEEKKISSRKDKGAKEKKSYDKIKESNEESGNNFLKVSSPWTNGSLGSKSFSGEVHPRKAFAVNRSKLTVASGNGFPKSFSTDDERLIQKDKQHALTERPFHSLEEESRIKPFTKATGMKQLKFGSETGQNNSPGRRIEKLSPTKQLPSPPENQGREIQGSNLSNSGANDLYDIPEDPNEDVIENKKESKEIKRSLGRPKRRYPPKLTPLVEIQEDTRKKHLNVEENDLEVVTVSSSRDPSVEKVQMSRDLSQEGSSGPRYQSRLTDLSVPLLSVPLGIVNSPKLFQTGDEKNSNFDSIPQSPLIVPVPENSNKSDGLEYTDNPSQYISENDCRIFAPHSSSRDYQNDKHLPDLKLKSLGKKKLHGEIFNFEMRDLNELESSSDTNLPDTYENSHWRNKPHVISGPNRKDEDESSAEYNDMNLKSLGNGDARVSAKDLRERFKQTKASRILAENLTEASDDVIFL